MNYLDWTLSRFDELDERDLGKDTLYHARRARADRVMATLKRRYGNRVQFAGISHDYDETGRRQMGLAFVKDGKERVAHLDNDKGGYNRTQREWDNFAAQNPQLAPRGPGSKDKAARLYRDAQFPNKAGKGGRAPNLPGGLNSLAASMYARAIRATRGEK